MAFRFECSVLTKINMIRNHSTGFPRSSVCVPFDAIPICYCFFFSLSLPPLLSFSLSFSLRSPFRLVHRTPARSTELKFHKQNYRSYLNEWQTWQCTSHTFTFVRCISLRTFIIRLIKIKYPLRRKTEKTKCISNCQQRMALPRMRERQKSGKTASKRTLSESFIYYCVNDETRAANK